MTANMVDLTSIVEAQAGENRKLHVLLILNELSGYTTNHEVLRACLDEVGHKVSYDNIMGDLGALEESGLVTLTVSAELTVATLTQRAQDVATGRTEAPGVMKPPPVSAL